MRANRAAAAPGLTLIELMIVVAVVAIAATLAAPSFREMIQMQRLRGINAQLVTDLQFARSEAVARGRVVRVNLGSDSDQTCYVIYTAAGNGITRCNCTLAAGMVCAAGGANAQEIRTVGVPRSGGVAITWPSTQDTAFGYDHITGGLVTIPTDSASTPLASVQIETRIDDDRRLRNTVLQTGRPTVCAPNAARMGVGAC
jgi:type IV fimbrial biogenesis protein FimT